MAGSRSEEQPGARDGCAASPDGLERINSFSLVSYIPGALGRFLTGMRRDLVPGCVARAHVTVLPPRPLAASPVEAAAELKSRLAAYEGFEVSLPRLSVFEQSQVVFAEVAEGRDELLAMHEALNTGIFSYDEPWEYHPHVTLAQGLTPEELPARYALAKDLWESCAPADRFPVETLVFVQNTVANRWIDLVEYELRVPLAIRR